MLQTSGRGNVYLGPHLSFGLEDTAVERFNKLAAHCGVWFEFSWLLVTSKLKQVRKQKLIQLQSALWNPQMYCVLCNVAGLLISLAQNTLDYYLKAAAPCGIVCVLNLQILTNLISPFSSYLL